MDFCSNAARPLAWSGGFAGHEHLTRADRTIRPIRRNYPMRRCAYFRANRSVRRCADWSRHWA